MADNTSTEPLLAKTDTEEEEYSPKPRSCTAWLADAPGLLWDNGLLCVIVSAFLFSTMSVLVKLLGHGVPTFQIVLCRSVVSFSLTLSLLWGYGVRPLFGSPKRFGLLSLRGFLGAAGMTLSYFGIAHLPLAEAVTIFFSNPALTALLEWLFTGEPLGLVGSMSSGACLLGVMLVANPPFLHGAGLDSWDLERLVGVGCSFGGAWLCAASFIAVRFLGKSEPALVLALWYHMVACITSGLPLLLSYPTAAILPDPHQLVLLTGVALTSFLGQLLLNRGFQLESATKASAVNVTQVLYSYMWDIALFHHSITLQAVAGSFLIMVGVIVTSKRRRANKATSKLVASQLQSAATSPTAQHGLARRSASYSYGSLVVSPRPSMSLAPGCQLPVPDSTIPEDEPVVIPASTIRRALSRSSLGYGGQPVLTPTSFVPIAGTSPAHRWLDDNETGHSTPAGTSPPLAGSLITHVGTHGRENLQYLHYHHHLGGPPPAGGTGSGTGTPLAGSYGTLAGAGLHPHSLSIPIAGHGALGAHAALAAAGAAAAAAAAAGGGGGDPAAAAAAMGPRVGSLARIGSVAESVMSWFEDPLDDYDRYGDQAEEEDPVVLYQGLVDRNVAEVCVPEASLYTMA